MFKFVSICKESRILNWILIFLLNLNFQIVLCLAVALVSGAPNPKASPEPKAKPDVLLVDEPATTYLETSYHGNLVYPSYASASYIASPYAYSSQYVAASPYAYNYAYAAPLYLR
jgi:hypothetical protein